MLAGFLLAVANFMVVLDMTIANVSVPNIAGGLAVSPNQGTWVITSYAVAEAIMVPLTGWLAQRFGAVQGVRRRHARLRPLLGALRPGAIAGLAGAVPGDAGHLRRADDAACRRPCCCASSRRSSALRRWALWAMTTVVAPDRRPDPRRRDLRQRRLAVGVLHQRAGRGRVRRSSPGGCCGQPRDPDRSARRRLRRPGAAGAVGRGAADHARQGQGAGLVRLAGHRRPGRHRGDRLRLPS